jgi:hypothetical protein
MRNTNWLRYGLASIIIGGVGTGSLLVACGDDDAVGPRPDGGTPDVEQPDSAPPVDAGTDTGRDAGPPNAKITVVNAATDLGPNANFAGTADVQAVRVCFAIGATAESATVSGLPPQPDEARGGLPAGIFLGTGGAMKSFGLDLSPFVLVPYVMNAAKLAEKGIVKPGPGDPGVPCDKILDGDFRLDGASFEEGVDYWKLDPIEANTFQKDKSIVLVLTGCTDDTALPTPGQKCGDGFEPSGSPGKGNLEIHVFEVDRKTEVPADAIGTQFIHASYAASVAFPAAGQNFVPSYRDPNKAATAGGNVAYAAKTEIHNATEIKFDPDGGSSFSVNSGALNQPPFTYTLAQIQQFSFGQAGPPTGSELKNGAAFTFIAVGDPDLAYAPTPGGPFNTRWFHFLAFPNDPEVETYSP